MLIKKIKNIFKGKKGFTLVELLAVIVVITLISGVGIITYLKTINNSKSKATLLAINNVKEAAYLYSKEGTDEIEWVNSYDENGKESGKYACVSVQQLINKGYFKDNFFDKEIYKNSKIKISKNTFIEVRMGTNNDNLKVVVNKNDNTEDKCIGSAINGNLFHLKLGNDSKSYTDTIKLNVSKKDTKKVVKKYTVSINDEKNSVEDSSDGRNVTFGNLKNSTLYKIKACMTTEDNNYYCDSFDIFTKDFIKPKFDIKSGWEKAKTININYYDTPIYHNKGSHYFTSEVSGEVKKGTVYRCNDDYSVCSSNSDGIVESGKNYKLNDNEVSFTTTDNIDKGVSKKLTAIIKDPTKNSDESSGTVNKIDNIAPICNASSSNSNWTNKAVTISSTCYDGNGSGCKKTIFTKKYDSEFVGNASIEVIDKADNISTCKALVMIDKTKPTCTVSSSNSNWTNQDVTVTGTCSDSKSDCKAKKISVTKNSNIDDDVSPGTVYDNAGNKTQCGTTRVKIDKTPPVAKIGHDDDNYTLTDESTDSGGSKIVSSSWSGNVTNINKGNATSNGNGGKAILKVKDGAGNWSEPTSISVYKYCSKTHVNQTKPNKVDNVKVEAYYWGNKQKCNGVNRNYNNFHEYGCQCKQDAVTEKSCGTSAQWEYDTHNTNQATIHYDSAKDCNNNKTNNIHYLCSSEDRFTAAYNAIKDGPKLYYFHGLYWFNGNNTTNSNVIKAPGSDYPWTISSDRKSAKYSKDYTKEKICELACAIKYGTN